MINVKQIKKDFPIFKHDPSLVYLDSTNTSLKLGSIVEKLREYYEQYPANVKRGIYKISERATEEYEKTREMTAKLIGAKNSKEIVFTRGTTESINLVAYSLGREIVSAGDEVVVSLLEHHSNFVPWQQLAFEVGADFKVINITEDGYLDLGKNFENIEQAVSHKTKILALTLVSNALGTINPIKKIIAAARRINPNIIIVVDAAQAVPHMKVDVQDLDCDFLAFSFHKMLGPTGAGVLWGQYELLEKMFPFQYGGEMIENVAIEGTTFTSSPDKFEAGTPSIADVIAAQPAISYLQNIGFNQLRNHEEDLLEYSHKRLREEFSDKIHIYGPTNIKDKAAIITFTLGKIHPHDIAQILDEDNIAIRAGHHCTMPLHKSLTIPASARASFYLYNDRSDVDKLVAGLQKVIRLFR